MTVKSWLARPRVYEAFQSSIGATGARRRFVTEFVQPSPGARVLDVGCGPGGLVESFDNASEYRGFDASPEYVAEANAKFAGRGTFEVARVNDGLNWPTDGPFDHVIGVGLLHHMADVDVRWFFREALRVLRPGGVAVTIDPVFHDGQNPVARRLAAADRGEFVRQFEEYQLLASSHAEHVNALVLTDMLRIPYSHCVMRVTAS